MSILNITNENYKELVENSKKTVLLDFWAGWCMPCKMLSPIVDEVASERDDVMVGKINVDEQSELASKFNISSIPTLVVVKDGKIVKQSMGYMPKEDVLRLLK